MNLHHHRFLILMGIMLFLLLSPTGCGQKRIHVATTSGAPGAADEQAMIEDESTESRSRGLSDADLQASALEGEESVTTEATAEQEPVMFAHEVAPLSDNTMLPDDQANTSAPEGVTSENDGNNGALESAREIQSQSRSPFSPESSLSAADQGQPEGPPEPSLDAFATPYPELEGSEAGMSRSSPADQVASAEPQSPDASGSPDSRSQSPDAQQMAENSPGGGRASSEIQPRDHAPAAIPGQEDEGLMQGEEQASMFSAQDGQSEEPEVHQPQPLALSEGDEPGAVIPPESVPEEIAVAKVEPSDAIQHQLEQFKEEETEALHDIFFEFDSWTLTPEGRAALETNADWLKAQPSASLLIQGHCDERGTQAYNMVLGEKRAMAIRDYLVELGIDPSRLTIVSYGKEKPFCTDPTEVCYQLNRRGHFVVRRP